MPDDASLRKHLVELLSGGSAHITFADAIADFPVELAGLRPAGVAHSAWELLEHMRIAQYDILAFSGGAPEPYQELDWPGDYWPPSQEPASPDEWAASVTACRRDLDRFLILVQDPQRDLYQPFPWGQGQTLLREALLIADHNAYHLGQLVQLRRMLEHTRG